MTEVIINGIKRSMRTVSRSHRKLKKGFGVHFSQNNVEESVCDFIAAHYRELSNIFLIIMTTLEKGGAINA